jgi:hypothetical protein
VSGASEFEAILDSRIAAATCPPFLHAIVDSRPNPAIRFAMWGGGVPPVDGGYVSRPAAGPRGVSPRSESCGTGKSYWSQVRAELDGNSASVSPRGRSMSAAPEVRPQAPRRPRQLDPRARAALNVLRSSGAASLDEAFSPAELKAAYRRLAFRFHPDRHPAASRTDRAELGQSFASITAAYRCLCRL